MYVTVQELLSKTNDFVGYERVIVKYKVITHDGIELTGHHICEKGYTINKGKKWNYVKVTNEHYVLLTTPFESPMY